jgi:hypothetical protein
MKLRSRHLEDLRESLAFYIGLAVFLVALIATRATLTSAYPVSKEGSVAVALVSFGTAVTIAIFAQLATSKLLRFYAIVHGAEVEEPSDAPEEA